MSTIQPAYEFNTKRLKAARVERDISPADVAAALGITTPSYYNKERGATATTVKELCTIMTVLKMTPADAAYFFTEITGEE